MFPNKELPPLFLVAHIGTTNFNQSWLKLILKTCYGFVDESDVNIFRVNPSDFSSL